MERFTENIINTYGDSGRSWLTKLPEILKACSKTWGFQVIRVYPNLTYSYVVEVRTTHVDAVVKFIFNSEQFTQELGALKLFQGSNCIQLLNHSVEYQAILLTKAEYSLETLFPDKEIESISIYASFIKKCLSENLEKSTDIPDVKQWLTSINKSDGISDELIIKAWNLSKTLNMSNSHLLHGDLHHGNLLKYKDSWIMIDPKCIIGPIEFEISAFLINPKNIVQQDIQEIINFRIDKLSAALDLNDMVLTKWAFVRAILASCWCIEDNIAPIDFIKVAESINKILNKKSAL